MKKIIHNLNHLVKDLINFGPHHLNHLVKDLINFGPHQNNNMFHFENFNHLINLLVHTNNFFDAIIFIITFLPIKLIRHILFF
jgi:hypothetical protein